MFKKQLQECIIERIPDIPSCYEGYVWVLHRPVFRTEGKSTTKVQPNFNCPLKKGTKLSLNEAAHSGIELMFRLLDLSIKFHSNNFFLAGGYKTGFLANKTY